MAIAKTCMPLHNLHFLYFRLTIPFFKHSQSRWRRLVQQNTKFYVALYPIF
jgi:hypothetical protein